ncbi:hypothetical protein [Sediminicoccus sp. BL-A-41-H5]|uniref:hypothetical protein n=1 Tax=Sediminicoccus sp. BL-A-41-H5 TaxID=3421106 RepID=UPI003D6797B1
MSRSASVDLAERMQHLLHDLSQPLLAAALSVDTALILLPAGHEAAALKRVEAASDELKRALMIMRALKLACGREPGLWASKFDPAQILNQILGGKEFASVGEILGDRDYFEAAMAGLVMTLRPTPDSCRAYATTYRKGIQITLRGGDSQPDMLRFWMDALRKAGIGARARRMGAGTVVSLSVPT